LVSVGVSNRAIDDYTLTLVAPGSNGRWVGRPINAGRAHARGLEMEAKFPLKLLNADLPAVELRGSLSRNWSSVEQVAGQNNRMAQQVPLQASLSLDYSFGALTTGGSFVFRKGTWTTVTAAQSALTVNRRDLDLYALWKLNLKQQIRLTLANLLKSDDISASQYRMVAGSTATRTTTQAGNASLRALFEHKF
jgi:outer membrane receptor for ferrienterochelin and colicins